jgi:hypothetical protein
MTVWVALTKYYRLLGHREVKTMLDVKEFKELGGGGACLW